MGTFEVWRRRVVRLGSVAVIAAALVVVIPLLTGGTDPAPDPPIGRAAGPPSFDQVLRIRDELRAAAAESDYPVDAASLAAVTTVPGPYTTIGRVAFPTTGLDVEVGAGVQPSVLERGPGHWPGTALPGQPGNAVVSGHRTTFTHPFADLDRLRPGDPILVTVAGAAGPVRYLVIETLVVPEVEYVPLVLRQPVDPSARELTLFACHPEGRRTHRIVVRASAPPAGEGG